MNKETRLSGEVLSLLLLNWLGLLLVTLRLVGWIDWPWQVCVVPWAVMPVAQLAALITGLAYGAFVMLVMHIWNRKRG